MNDYYRLLEAVLNHLPEGVVIVDSQDRVVFMNRAAAQVRQADPTKILGRSVVLCHSEQSHEKVKRALQYLRTMRSDHLTRMVVDSTRNAYYENVYFPLFSEDGEYMGTVLLTKDITAKRNLEIERAQDLQRKEEKIEELTDKLNQLYSASLLTLVRVLECKDRYTAGHSERVSEMASRLAEAFWGGREETD
ncbi:MAG TPA: PAS domain-containing protein [Firmicutes bacterium]|nr:PAS domain-containing protein [Bacillota bacterium]